MLAYQPAEARTAAGSRYPQALRPCPPACLAFSMPAMGVLRRREALWRRVVGVSPLSWCNSLAGLVAALYVHIQRRRSNAPPNSGERRSFPTIRRSAALPPWRRIRPTMIELLSAWNSHEVRYVLRIVHCTSVRTC